MICGRLVESASTSSCVKRMLHSRLLATGLHGSRARHHDDELGAEVGEDVGAGPAETVAIGQQHDDRGNAPGHAQHGERGAAPIVAHGSIGFLKQITKHVASPFASLLPQRFHRLQHGRLARRI